MTEAVNTISFPVEATGADVAARQYAELSKNVGTAGTAHTSFAKTAKVANDNMAQLRKTNEATGKVVALLTRSFSNLHPAIGAVGESAGAAISSFKAITSFMGGPMALALTAATAAISMMGMAWTRQAEAAEKAKKASEEAAKAETYGARLEAIRAAKAEADARRKLTEGGATGEEYKAKLAELKGKIEAGGGVTYGKGALQDEYRRVMEASKLTAQMAKDKAELELQIEEAGGLPSGGAPSSKRSAMGAKTPSGESQLDALMRADPNDSGMADSILADSERRSAEMVKVRDAEAKALMELDRARTDAEKANAQARIDAINAESEARSAAAEKWIADNETALNIGRMTTTATVQGLAALAKGHKVSLGAIVETIGDGMVAHGTSAMWQGMVNSLNPLAPGSGSAQMVAGLAEIAAGMALGAAGAAGGGAAKSGGSGRSAPVSPYSASGGSQQSGGAQVVNVYMQSVVSPSAEDGRRVEDALAKSRNVYGRRAV